MLVFFPRADVTVVHICSPGPMRRMRSHACCRSTRSNTHFIPTLFPEAHLSQRKHTRWHRYPWKAPQLQSMRNSEREWGLWDNVCVRDGYQWKEKWLVFTREAWKNNVAVVQTLRRALWRRDEGLRPVVVVESSSFFFFFCTCWRLRCDLIREYMGHRSTVMVLAFVLFLVWEGFWETSRNVVWESMDDTGGVFFFVLCFLWHFVTWVTGFQGGVNMVELADWKGGVGDFLRAVSHCGLLGWFCFSAMLLLSVGVRQ